MSFPRYPKYKPCGAEWLGEVPEHWGIKRFHHLSTIQKGRLPVATSPSRTSENELPYLSMEFLRGESDSPSYAPLTANSIRAEQGDILLLWDGSNAGEFLRAKCGIVSSTIARIEGKNIHKDFLFFACKALEGRIRDQTVGMGIPHVCGDDLRSYAVVCPTHPEQTQIANFLTGETAKIDSLVAEQQRLIELLKQKRQAVISHAVTKGLNPNAPLKPSGVEWLGDTPAHWKLTKFGNVSSVVRGGSPRPAGDPALFNGDYSPWVTVAEITKDDRIDLTETETFLTKKGSDQCRVFSNGTLLLSNSGGSLGVPKILRIDANANDGVLGFEHLRLDLHFAYFYLSTLTDYLRETVRRTGGSTQINLNTGLIKRLPVPLPPPEEVKAIVKLIHTERDRCSHLTAEAERAIELLQERRTALISAAVTGQIDVRSM